MRHSWKVSHVSWDSKPFKVVYFNQRPCFARENCQWKHAKRTSLSLKMIQTQHRRRQLQMRRTAFSYTGTSSQPGETGGSGPVPPGTTPFGLARQHRRRRSRGPQAMTRPGRRSLQGAMKFVTCASLLRSQVSC